MKIDFEKFNSKNIGAFLNIIHPKVESNREALLIQLLTIFGNCIGQSAHFKAAEDIHHTNLFVVLVGESSRGRKGQSLNMIKQPFKDIDHDWYSKRIKKGLSSGEGLIKNVSDEIDTDPKTNFQITKNIQDK